VTTLTVWKFPDAEGADRGEATLELFQQEGLITIHDAAVVSWPPGAKKPKTRQLNDLAGTRALAGSFWGLLLGFLFFVPLLGAAVGAATGALAGPMRDVGIDDDFITSVRDQVTPGTSALFVLSSDAVLDKVHDAFAGENAELIQTNLDNAQEAHLREVFAE
jgi:uncharacterized membrane protein